MSNIEATIQSVCNLMGRKLSIPSYQRPYRWNTKNVRQLLDDILSNKNAGKDRYRIGSVILHKNGDNYDIVDGQQRITTLLLLAKAMDVKYNLLAGLKYKHINSIFLIFFSLFIEFFTISYYIYK